MRGSERICYRLIFFSLQNILSIICYKLERHPGGHSKFSFLYSIFILISIISAFSSSDFIWEHKTGLSTKMIIKKCYYFPKIRTFGLSSMIFHGDKNLMNLLWYMKRRRCMLYIDGRNLCINLYIWTEATPFYIFVKLNITTTIIFEEIWNYYYIWVWRVVFYQ